MIDKFRDSHDHFGWFFGRISSRVGISKWSISSPRTPGIPWILRAHVRASQITARARIVTRFVFSDRYRCRALIIINFDQFGKLFFLWAGFYSDPMHLDWSKWRFKIWIFQSHPECVLWTYGAALVGGTCLPDDSQPTNGPGRSISSFSGGISCVP